MYSQKQITRTSKFLSLVLRHKPEEIGLTLDPHGWVRIDELIDHAHSSGKVKEIDRALIEEVVATNDKQRFAISEDGQRIRASQGHSIPVDLQLAPVVPPAILYHGTASRFLDTILREGLTPQQRQFVHLSRDRQTALAVGKRHGKPVILRIDTQAMQAQGCVFHLSDNGVWLTARVLPCFIEVVERGDGSGEVAGH